MENMMITINENEIKQPFTIFTMLTYKLEERGSPHFCYEVTFVNH